MTEAIISVVCLHQTPELIHECSELLNKQWPRSSSARIQSLEKSFKDLPDSLLLIEKINDENKVIGHGRLTRVLEDNHGCWIGSVVICEEKRKQGYGKFLMNKIEEYARKLKFSTAYLNTQDQEGFYEHLGYTYCEPVSSIGFRSVGYHFKGPFNVLKKESFTSNSLYSEHSELSIEKDLKNKSLFPNIPPPPPLPEKKHVINTLLKSNLGQYWMKKLL